MQQLKYSRQRESIKNFLMTRKDHPTADVVYTNVRKEYPNISLGDGPDRFDGNPLPHYHFICKKCGSVIDLEMDDIDQIDKIANANFGGVVEGHVAYFYGRCEDCK